MKMRSRVICRSWFITLVTCINLCMYEQARKLFFNGREVRTARCFVTFNAKSSSVLVRATNAFPQVSYEVDEGGNSFPVDFFGTSTNLHSVWDTQMIKRYENGSWWNIANELVAFLDENPDVLKGYVAMCLSACLLHVCVLFCHDTAGKG